MWATVMAALLYFDFAWFREQTCLVVCPYGRLQSALDRRRHGRHRLRRSSAASRASRRPRRAATASTAAAAWSSARPASTSATACRWSASAARTASTPATRSWTSSGGPRGLVRYDSKRGFDGVRAPLPAPARGDLRRARPDRGHGVRVQRRGPRPVRGARPADARDAVHLRGREAAQPVQRPRREQAGRGPHLHAPRRAAGGASPAPEVVDRPGARSRSTALADATVPVFVTLPIDRLPGAVPGADDRDGDGERASDPGRAALPRAVVTIAEQPLAGEAALSARPAASRAVAVVVRARRRVRRRRASSSPG